MIRFEELQMRLMDAAKKYLDVYSISTLIEQYSLNKESRFSMTLPEIKPPYPISATISFSYNAHQTSFSMLFDEDEFEDESENFDNMVEVEIVISLPFLEDYNQSRELFEEIVNQYPELDFVFIRKEFFKKNLIEGEDYEIVYSYLVGGRELKNIQFYEEIFFELSSLLKTIYERSKFYIDISWYTRQDDDLF